MDILVNPLEELFASLSALFNIASYLLPSECSGFFCDVLYIVVCTFIFFLFLFLWLAGHRIVGFLYPLATLVSAYLYIRYTSPAEENFWNPVSTVLLMLAFLGVALLIDRYRGALLFMMLAAFLGQFLAQLLGQEAIIGVYIAVALSFILFLFPVLLAGITVLFDMLVALVTAAVGGSGISLAAALFVSWLINLTPLAGFFGPDVNLFSLIFAVLMLILIPALWVGSVGLGILAQFTLMGLQESDEKGNTLVYLFDSFFIAIIAAYISLSAGLLNSETMNTLPVNAEVAQLSPIETWLKFQNFSQSAIRPWFNYPWEKLSEEQSLYLITSENGLDAYACPSLTCEVLNHYGAGVFSTSNPPDWTEQENTVGWLGISDSANIIETVEGETVDGSNLWYVAVNRDFQILYVPGAYLSIESRERDTLQLPIVNIAIMMGIGLIVLFYMAGKIAPSA